MFEEVTYYYTETPWDLRGILDRAMGLLERFRTETYFTRAGLLVLAGMIVFGALNCLLGYRLLRFWVMIFGFAAGAFLGFLGGTRIGIQENLTLLLVMAGTGIVVGVIAFLIYRLGIFVLAAGIGLGVSMYLLRPASSAMFFLCILIGAAVGALGVRYSRPVIIIGTSLLGGLMAGFAAAKYLGLGEMYGFLISAAAALLGMLVQFLTNRPQYEDVEEDEGPLESEADLSSMLHLGRLEEDEPDDFYDESGDEDEYVEDDAYEEDDEDR